MNTRMATTALAVSLATVALINGVHTGSKVLDTDEAVYQRTLLSMRAGNGYYQAMSGALVVKEGARPTSVRAIRPPTMFLLLRWFPQSSWRWIVGLVYLAVLLAMARLGEPFGNSGAPIAVVLGGIWMIGASSYLYLHAELWGLPFFLAGLVAFRRGNERGAAILMGVAGVVRELFVLAVVIALFLGKKRRVWLVALGSLALLFGLHYWLAHGFLSRTGHEVSLGNEPITFHSVLRFLSPGDKPLAFGLGVGMLALGFAGVVRNLTDRAARLGLPYSIILLIAGIIATRSYWNLTYGPAVSAFVPALFSRGRSPLPDGTPAPPA